MKSKIFLTLILLFIFSIPAISADKLKGKVLVDGSSTVFPISEAVAEDFRESYPRVRVAIGVSGTGGGFKKFLKNETDINNASRTIKDKEIQLAKKTNIQYEEFEVAYDGISIVVNKGNTWATDITAEELKKIWMPGSKVETWKDIRLSWPDKKIRLYGPGTASGTFDYFTEAINGKSHVSRSNYTKSEDDNVLVQGIADDIYAMAYFGFAYYQENKNKIRAIPIIAKGAKKAVAPTLKTINDGSYKPLSRPVYIYLNIKSLTSPGVYEYLNYYFENAQKLVQQVGYVPLKESNYKASMKKLKNLKARAQNGSSTKKK